MSIHTTGQWVLLFFFYCFCGWVWESCYVSARQRRWVNRGFLQGPLLPIYGTGAILILFVTLPVKDNLWLVWLLGMLAATLLEYVTGAVMEALFQVRYWDYSNQKCNLHGYICLTSSIAWGFFSVLMVRFVHPPVERLLQRIPDFLVDPLALVLTVFFTIDVVQSVHAALDLREVLARLTEENEDLRRLTKRVEVAAAFAEDDLRRFRARTELNNLLIRDRIRHDTAAQAVHSRKLRELDEYRVSVATQLRMEILDAVGDAVDSARNRLETAVELTEENRLERRKELEELVEQIHEKRLRLRYRTARDYRRAMELLRRHPSAMAKNFGEALEDLRNLSEREHK